MSDGAPDAGTDGGVPDGAPDGGTDASTLVRMWTCPSGSGQFGPPACAASGLLDLGSGVASGFDVNDRGDVATGGSQYQTGIFLGKERCFVTTPMQYLIPVDTPYGVFDVVGLNARSTLVTSIDTPHGQAGYACNGDCNGFRYFAPHPAPTMGVQYSNSWFMGFNDSDQFVGFATFQVSLNGFPATYTHAYLWQWPNGTPGTVLVQGQDLSDPSWTVTNPVGSGADLAVAINPSGQVAGAAGTHAALWSGGTKTDLGTLGGTPSRATGINAAGQVIGVSKTASGATHAFIWSGGVMTDLGSLAGASGTSVATAINSSGQVAGTSTTASGTVHAFSWKNGVMTDLGTLGGTASMASSPAALAADPNTPPGGGAWTTTIAGTPLASPNSSNGSVVLLPRGRRAINDAGQIAGTSTTSTGQTHAFVWSAGVMKDLGTLGGTSSEGAAINSLGQATGVAAVPGDTASHGFLYDPAGCL